MQIVKANVTQQVIEYLKENLESGNWQVGEKIPSENQLTQILGVSRSSVRTAIQQLIGIGCLESIHGKGTFVVSSSMNAFGSTEGITEADCQNLREVLEYRLVLEPEISLMAAQKATFENIQKLRFYLENMKKNVGKSEAFVRYDILFHEEICRATGNHLLEKSLSEVFQQKLKTHEQINEVFGYKDGIYYHNLILSAIEARDAKRARRLMKAHIQKAIDELKA